MEDIQENPEQQNQIIENIQNQVNTLRQQISNSNQAYII